MEQPIDLSWNEEDRLKAVEAYDILDTPREEEFDDIVKMAAEVCNVPVSLISFVTSNRQWFKAEVGTGLSETPLSSSICSYAILQRELFVVPDTTKDARFVDNPLVKGDPNFRFYAGALLSSPEGLPLGTVCVLDYRPRNLSDKEGAALKALARQVMTQLELRRTLSRLRRALKAKNMSEERLNLALESSDFIGIWEWDVVNDLVYADARFVLAFGGRPDWVNEGVPIANYVKAIHPDHLPRVNAAIEHALRSTDLFREEYRLRQADGSTRWIEARGRCHFDKEGKPVRFPGVAVDITSRKISEQKALEAAGHQAEAVAKFRALFDQSSVFAGIMALDGSVLEANRMCLENCGYQASDVLGKFFWDCPWWGASAETQNAIREATKRVVEGTPYTRTCAYWVADGSERILDLALHPIRNGAGNVIFIHPTGVDVTERHQAHARAEFLSHLTQKLSLLSGPEELNRVATREVGQFLGGHRCYFFEAVPPLLHTRVLPDWCRTDEASLEGVYDLADFGATEMWETLQSRSAALDDVSAHPWTTSFSKNYQALNIGAALIAPFCREGKWVACLGLSSDLPRRWKPDEQSLLENVMARVWPLIERARSEVALRESEERFRAMSDNIAPLAWMAHADGSLFWYNKRWYDFTGGTLETMRGDGWAQAHDPEHLPHVISTWKKALVEGHRWEDTFPLRGKSGNYRWFLSRAFPIRDSEGKITLWFGVNTDITELREAQDALREANVQLGDKAKHLEVIVQQRTHKLSETIAELEAFSYSISHDMRAPLRSMIGFAEILKEDYGTKLDATGVQHLNRISNASRRMDQLIQDVLVFSRLSREEIVLKSVNADVLIREIIASYPNLQADLVQITFASPLPSVMGNEALLTQCFSNLLENAAKFTKPGGKPEIKVWGEHSQDRVKLYFQDNGIGMSEHNLTRIFDIFHRVGRETDGTGIGLAIVRKAAEKMGGSVGVKSELGEGSVFWLDLHPA